MGHMGGLINPRPGRGQDRTGFSNTGGSPKPRKRAPCQKKILPFLQTIRTLLIPDPLYSILIEESTCCLHAVVCSSLADW